MKIKFIFYHRHVLKIVIINFSPPRKHSSTYIMFFLNRSYTQRFPLTFMSGWVNANSINYAIMLNRYHSQIEITGSVCEHVMAYNIYDSLDLRNSKCEIHGEPNKNRNRLKLNFMLNLMA